MDKLKKTLVNFFTRRHHHNHQLSSSDTIAVKMADWSKLPDDLLMWIAERLDLIDLLRFRTVCKDWNNSSSSASAVTESENKDACLLLYGEGSKCTFFHQKLKRKYTIEIPELEGSTCIASSHGWILLFKSGLLFFFCPFSRAEIHLPQILGLTTITNHVAVFSAPPTCKDCMVSVIHKRSDENDTTFEINLLTHGADSWTKYEKPTDGFNGEITGVFYHGNGVFYYAGTEDSIGVFSLTEGKWKTYRLVYWSGKTVKTLPFALTRGESYRNDEQNKWIREDEISNAVPTCGTVLPTTSNLITDSGSSDTSYNLKGVWIQPRFFQVPRQQNWSEI